MKQLQIMVGRSDTPPTWWIERARRIRIIGWAACAVVCLAVAGKSLGQDSDAAPATGEARDGELAEPGLDSASTAVAGGRRVTRQDLITSLTIFVLAVFVGFEVITKVPPTLHTPLMSGSNAISGITLVGAVIVAASPEGWFSPSLGFIAVTLATVNAVGGFMVTHRMLAMFKR